MSMADRSEAAMTELLDTVARVMVGEDYDKANKFEQYQYKQNLLPVVTACIDALDAEPYRPKRGSDIEVWLRWHRDSLPSTKVDDDWLAVDALIDDYIRRADIGTPLTEEE